MQEIVDRAQATAGDVVEQAKETAGRVADQAKEQATSRLAEQKERAVEGLGTVAQAVRQTGQELRKHDQDAVGRYADTAAQQVERVASYLRTRDVPDLLDDLQDLARRQPALFLGGALALGALGARFLMSSGERAARRERALQGVGRRGPSGVSSYPATGSHMASPYAKPALAGPPGRPAVSGPTGMMGNAGPGRPSEPSGQGGMMPGAPRMTSESGSAPTSSSGGASHTSGAPQPTGLTPTPPPTAPRPGAGGV